VLRPLRREERDESGAVAIMMALTLAALLVVTALVLDFGLVRLDRQANRSAADSAVTTGLRAADGGDGSVYTFRAVCGALASLKANRPQLSGLPAGICATPDNTVTCGPGVTATHAAYTGSVTHGNSTYTVWIKSPYTTSDASMDGGTFPEDALATLAADTGDPAQQGCDQVAVVIKQATEPGLGSLATDDSITTRIRSVGRVAVTEGDLAPALLLLERTRCSVLTVGSAGAPSSIRVYGSGTIPGSIHADSNGTGSGCGSGSGQQLLQGKQTNGIEAYGAGGARASSPRRPPRTAWRPMWSRTVSPTCTARQPLPHSARALCPLRPAARWSPGSLWTTGTSPGSAAPPRTHRHSGHSRRLTPPRRGGR